MPTALITGTAGFIGFFAAQRLLKEGFKVVGVDSLTDYYDVSLKKARLKILESNTNFYNRCFRIEQPGLLVSLFETEQPDIVIHLAAQAGVRYSIDNPRAYLESNLQGTFELLEAARSFPPNHVLLASTSSVYGANAKMPYQEIQSLTINYLSTQQLRSQLKAWHILIRIFLNCRLQCFASLPCMVHGVDLTWLFISLQKLFSMVSQSMFIIMAI